MEKDIKLCVHMCVCIHMKERKGKGKGKGKDDYWQSHTETGSLCVMDSF